MAIDVRQVAEITDDVVKAFHQLLPQLSKSAAPLDADGIRTLVGCPTNTVLLARREDDYVVGMLTLVVFPIPTGLRARIEDVVVDEAARGQGVGATLCAEAIRRAHDLGARTIELTSRPSREAANRLYVKLGFELRETNVYCYSGS